MTLNHYFIFMKVLATILLVANRSTGEFGAMAGAFDGVLLYTIWRTNLK